MNQLDLTVITATANVITHLSDLIHKVSAGATRELQVQAYNNTVSYFDRLKRSFENKGFFPVPADEKDLIIAGLEEGAEAWKAEYENCRNILWALVELKNEKDKYGKTESYLAQQPKMWERAKQFLEKYQHETF